MPYKGTTSTAVHLCRSPSHDVRCSPPESRPVAVLSCCTVPSRHPRKLNEPAPGRRTLYIAPDCIGQPPRIAVKNGLSRDTQIGPLPLNLARSRSAYHQVGPIRWTAVTPRRLTRVKGAATPLPVKRPPGTRSDRMLAHPRPRCSPASHDRLPVKQARPGQDAPAGPIYLARDKDLTLPRELSALLARMPARSCILTLVLIHGLCRGLATAYSPSVPDGAASCAVRWLVPKAGTEGRRRCRGRF
jgi:hypothetical protein